MSNFERFGKEIKCNLSYTAENESDSTAYINCKKMGYQNILIPFLKAVGENKKSGMHCSMHHRHLYANLEFIHRIVYWSQNGGRKKWYYYLFRDDCRQRRCL